MKTQDSNNENSGQGRKGLDENTTASALAADRSRAEQSGNSETEKHGNEMPHEGDIGCAFPEQIDDHKSELGNGIPPSGTAGEGRPGQTNSPQKHRDSCGENGNEDPGRPPFNANKQVDEGPQGNPAGGI